MKPTDQFTTLDAAAVDSAAAEYWNILRKQDPESIEDERWFESCALQTYRDQQFLPFDIFERLYWWKNRPYRADLEKWFRRNTPESVQKATSMAFAASTEEEGLRCLMGQPALRDSEVDGPGLLVGVRVPTASAILYWMKPEKVVIIDRKVVKVVFGFDLGDALQLQQHLAGIVRNKAQECECSLRHLDRALWAMGSRRQQRRRTT